MQENRLNKVLLPGPAVFYLSRALMVGASNPARNAEGLGSKYICVQPGSDAERDMGAYFVAHHLALHEFAFQEQDEMLDAYVAGRCGAIAGDRLYLAQLRRLARQTGSDFRLLPDGLSENPLLAATASNESVWVAIVAQSLDVLIHADTAKPVLADKNAQALAATAPSLRLDDGWKERLLQAAGNYRDMVRRNFGAGSPLELRPGPDALPTQDGLLSRPMSE
jgi:general L-amino acid transport system substrate-binding protein